MEAETDQRAAKPVMTIQEVSAFLRLPLSTVYLLAKKGKLGGGKFGKHWRFDKETILHYLRGGFR